MPTADTPAAQRAARVSAFVAVFGPLGLIGAGVGALLGWGAASLVVGSLLFASVWRATGRAPKS